jgi:hypothetical protein
MAWAGLSPHISRLGGRLPQTAGRSGRPNSEQRSSSVSAGQRTPAGFPRGIPGSADEMEGAMQQAAQPGRQASGSAMFFVPD